MARLPPAVAAVLSFALPLIVGYVGRLPETQKPAFLDAVMTVLLEMLSDADEKHIGHLPFVFRAKYESIIEDIYSAFEGGTDGTL